jgi:hypothetical protein
VSNPESTSVQFDLDKSISDCKEELRGSVFSSLSKALVTQSPSQLLELADNLELLTYYRGPRFPKIGAQIVRTALLSGLGEPTAEQIENIVEHRTADITETRVDQLIDEHIPVLPVAIDLSLPAWRIDGWELVNSHFHFDNTIIKNLKLGHIGDR